MLEQATEAEAEKEAAVKRAEEAEAAALKAQTMLAEREAALAAAEEKVAAAAAAEAEAEAEMDDGASEAGMSEASKRSRRERMKGAMSGAKGKLFGRRKKGEKELDVPPAQAEAEERAAELEEEME